MSNMRYCLCIFGSMFGLETMQDGDTRHCSFTQASLCALQQLHNKLLRLLLGHGNDIPTLQLLEESNMLSVNQFIAYSVMTTLFKVKQSKEPFYLANRLGFIQNNTRGCTHRRQHDIKIDFHLATARESFMKPGRKMLELSPSWHQTRKPREGL